MGAESVVKSLYRTREGETRDLARQGARARQGEREARQGEREARQGEREVASSVL